jgi:nucleoid DNA-binding protein
MPLSGTLTKTQLIDAVAERNGFTRKKSIETVGISQELIKQS